ncbi:MAG: hypothetical protein K0S47_2469 [Herbinix sp.]|jgi:uncharacterized phage-associated protein|nr:hypothetical protein [Herbinix sp.]
MKGNRIELGMEAVITADEIKMILERYHIGKKPLAKLLGWGETTIIRYMEGDIPTNEYSHKLKAILEDPEYYYDILMNRKESLTGVAFKKSKRAVLSKIMCSKIYVVTYYLANKCDADICASYLQYLLYYIQAFSLAFYDKEMFQEECGINLNNMPYQKLYNSMKCCGIKTLDACDEYLNEEEKELIDSIDDCFSWYGPKALRALTAYEKSMLKISRDKNNNKIISKDTIKAYFKDVLTQYGINEIKDIAKYPDQRIHELREMSL